MQSVLPDPDKQFELVINLIRRLDHLEDFLSLDVFESAIHVFEALPLRTLPFAQAEMLYGEITQSLFHAANEIEDAMKKARGQEFRMLNLQLSTFFAIHYAVISEWKPASFRGITPLEYLDYLLHPDTLESLMYFHERVIFRITSRPS